MGPPLHDSCFGDVKLLGDSWFTCSILVICDYLCCVEDADLCAIALKVTGGELVWMVCSCIPPGLPCAVALGWCFVAPRPPSLVLGRVELASPWINTSWLILCESQVGTGFS